MAEMRLHLTIYESLGVVDFCKLSGLSKSPVIAWNTANVNLLKVQPHDVDELHQN